MSLKTEKTEKTKKEKRYYTDFGKIKYFNIISDFFLFLFVFVVAFLFIDIIYILINYHFNFALLSLKNLKDLTLSVFKNLKNLKKFGVFGKVYFYFLISSISFFFIYLMYLFLQIKKANILAKLSSLNLENYRLKRRKNALLFLVRRGEELNKNDFLDENLENIRQVFNKYFKRDDEIIVERYKNKGFLIKKINLNVSNFSTKMLKKNQIFFGKSLKHNYIYVNVNELTHYLVVGQSGSGKSVFQNLLINQFIFNLKNSIEFLYLVDLKGGVEFLQYNIFKNVNVVTDVSQLLDLTRFLIQKMNDRYALMIKNNQKNWKKAQIIVMIDEYASVNDQVDFLEKDEAKQLKNNLRTLLAKARAAGIKFFIATQKATSDSIDTTLRENLQTKILMRTISKEAQKAVLGGKEIIDELGVEPGRFTKGRYIFFGEKIVDVTQAPFIDENFYLNLKKIRKDLVEKDKEKKEVIEFEKEVEEVVEEFEKEPKEVVEKVEEEPKEVEEVEKEAPKEIEEVEVKEDELKKAIEKRKELYKKTNEIENKKLKAEIRKKIKEIKDKQENEKIACLREIEEIEKKYFNDELRNVT